MKKKIVITGCSGQLGQAVAEILHNKKDYDVKGYTSAELNIVDQKGVRNTLGEENPYAIINCAAYTRVNNSEEDRNMPFLVNGLGARNLAIFAKETGAKLIHVSTDYVFDGEKNVPYTEFDEPNPLGAYAVSKLQGERFVQQFADRYFILRTCGLYGNGKNFVRAILEKAKAGQEIRVVGDQFVTPTSAVELARCISDLLKSENYGLFHATCEGACSWAEFAGEIIRLSGLDNPVKEISSLELGAKADRPAYSVLENYMLKMTGGYHFPGWKEALKEYLN